jgi:hypothetical protein
MYNTHRQVDASVIHPPSVGQRIGAAATPMP